jgi:superoxide dismutase, Fe-Mn family
LHVIKQQFFFEIYFFKAGVFMSLKKLVLPDLPYDYADLEPIISREIMEIHHDKHHAAYVNAANSLLDKIKAARAQNIIPDRGLLSSFSFNYNGALLHDLFWRIMRKPYEQNMPGEMLLQLIKNNFESFEIFQREFSAAAVSVEGSGWAVLYWDGHEGLTINQIEKHNVLALAGMEIILVLDVWEHAYYLQYKNNRAQFINNWWQLVNWDYVDHLIKK